MPEGEPIEADFEPWGGEGDPENQRTEPEENQTPVEAEAQPEPPPPPYEPTPEERDATLRVADSYLYDLDPGRDADRIMKERNNKKGAVAILGRIADRFLHPRTYGQRKRDNYVIGEIGRARYDAYSEERWSKALNPREKQDEKARKRGKEPEPLSKNEKQRLEEVARYREAIKYRNEAVKLIKERRDSTDLSAERAEEIERQLDHYYAYLIKLAHEDSYKFIYEYEEKKPRKRQKPGRTWYGRPKSRLEQQPGESSEDYRNRVAPKKSEKKLKDVRVYIEGQPREEPLAPEAGEPTEPIPASDRDDERHQAWVGDRLEGERTGAYFTRLEGPVKETQSKLGDIGLANDIKEMYEFLSQYSAKDLGEEDIEIRISKTATQKTYRYGRGDRGKTMPASPTIAISFKVEKGKTHVLTIFSDGVIEDNKRLERPTQKNFRENISLRHTIITIMPEKREPTRITLNPTLEQINSRDNALDFLHDKLTEIERTLTPKTDEEDE